jgi:hypothetical protein
MGSRELIPVSKLLHRKHNIPLTRRPGPTSAPPFRSSPAVLRHPIRYLLALPNFSVLVSIRRLQRGDLRPAGVWYHRRRDWEVFGSMICLMASHASSTLDFVLYSTSGACGDKGISIIALSDPIAFHRLTGGVGVTIGAKVAARIVHADIFADYASALFSLPLVLHV